MPLILELVFAQYLQYQWMEYGKHFAHTLIITRPWLRLLGTSVHQSVAELLSLFMPEMAFNVVFTQYVKNESMEFDNNLHMH